MELTPQAVAAATFRTVKRGYDPDEVRAYLVEVSASLEASHQQATAMEARARAAIAKLQGATQQPPAAQTSGQMPAVELKPLPVEEVSRTLLLAQRTADAAIADAHAQAAEITQIAHGEAAKMSSTAQAHAAATLDQARAEAARVLDDARAEAERAKSDAHMRLESEVRELEVRRGLLAADLERLERANTAHRDQLLGLAATMSGLVESLPDIEHPQLESVTAETALFGSLVRDTSPTPSGGFDRPSGAMRVIGESSNGDPSGGHLIPPPPITGQIPLQPGVEPLVSPRPTSADEVRSMWKKAELAEAGDDAAALVDATPVEGLDSGPGY